MAFYDIFHGVVDDLNFLECLQIFRTIRMSNDVLQTGVGSRKVPENETKALLDQTLSRKTADAVLVPVTPVL
jgi:hypothetical protein